MVSSTLPSPRHQATRPLKSGVEIRRPVLLRTLTVKLVSIKSRLSMFTPAKSMTFSYAKNGSSVVTGGNWGNARL